MLNNLEIKNKIEDKFNFTIVILTYNRCEILSILLNELLSIQRSDLETIIVDNGSTDDTYKMIKSDYPNFKVIRLNQNYGAIGRNFGMRIATGKYIVTIDDDILGFNENVLEKLLVMFQKKPSMGTVCFKVIDYYNGKVCNWCHPKKVEDYEDTPFETCEIAEGAVAFRRETLKKSGLYTKELFISHEGADLAARIIDAGYEIHYKPSILVKHKYARKARENWRRYYYDTRNDFWLVILNYRFTFGLTHLARRIPVTFIYSLRDGYLRYWFKAVCVAIKEIPKMLSQRRPISLITQRKLRLLNKHKPGLLYYFTKRFFSKQVRI